MGSNLLNSKAEFNGCAVPRLALKLGSRNVIENKEKEDGEDEQEKTIIREDSEHEKIDREVKK